MTLAMTFLYGWINNVLFFRLNTNLIMFPTSFFAGPGLSFAYILTRSTVGACFSTHYATANGIGHTGTSLGLMIIPPLIQLFLDTYGWRGALLLLGGITFHLVVCGALLTRRPSSTELKTTNENYIPVPASGEEKEKSHISSFKDTLMAQKKLFGISVCFKFSFWITSLVYICNNFVAGHWYIYYVAHVQAKGFTVHDAVAFTTAAAVGNLIFKICYGPFIDKGFVRLRPAIVMLTVVGSVCLLIDPWMNSYWLMMVNAFFFCGSSGALSPLNDSFTKELVGTELLACAFSWMELLMGILSFCLGFFPGKVQCLNKYPKAKQNKYSTMNNRIKCSKGGQPFLTEGRIVIYKSYYRATRIINWPFQGLHWCP